MGGWPDRAEARPDLGRELGRITAREQVAELGEYLWPAPPDKPAQQRVVRRYAVVLE